MGTLSLQASEPVVRNGKVAIAAMLAQRVALVRVSIMSHKANDKNQTAAKSRKTAPPLQAEIVVCTGAILGKGLIVAPVYAASDTPIRVTLPGGEQVRGQVRVIDEYSGLSLIRCKRKNLPGLEIETKLPAVGTSIASAAAWGVQEPVVSFGSVSGLRRNIKNVHFPPLLQCDIRTVGTSSGAALVNTKGKLVGIVVFSQVNRTRGWTYCVPSRHVQRLLRAQPKNPRSDSVVVIKRRRPIVGMVLDDNGSGIRVSRVRPESPAAKAGIQVGDHILSVDGMRIRSVYQAVIPNLNKQPGDVTKFGVRHNGVVRTVSVVLGGGMELPSAPFENLGDLVRPHIRISNRDGQYYTLQDRQWQNVPVSRKFQQGPPPMKRFTATRRKITREEQLQKLQRQVELYAKLVKQQEVTIRLLKKQSGVIEQQLKQLKLDLKQAADSAKKPSK